MRLLAIITLLSLNVFAQRTVDYERDIHPLLAAKCFGCHGGDKRSGGLSLRDYESMMQGGRSGAIVQSQASAESLIIRRVTGEVQPAMPPAGPRLTGSEVATLRAWIDQGARRTIDSPVARRSWRPSLALSAPAIPAQIWEAWTSPADRILAAYFRDNKLPRPSAVSDAMFARRAYLDVWGILPSPEELAQFTAKTSPDKRAYLLDTLLAQSTNYRDHWISFWNDLLRNDEGVQYGAERKSISGWLTKALDTNMPYDRMLSGLLNPSGPGAPEGFLTGVNWRGDVNASQTPAMQAAQNTAQVFLGINLKCASCHDSFVSPWKLKQSYGLAAYFAAEEKLELVRCDIKTGTSVRPEFLFPELSSGTIPGALPERHAEAARLFTDPRNGRMPRAFVNRIWQRLLGRGLVEPVDDMDAEPWSPVLLDWLAADLVSNGYDVKRLIRTIMLSQAYQLPTVHKSNGNIFRGPSLRRMTAEQFLDSLGAITGEWRTMAQPIAKHAVYMRESRLASNRLSLALGRPLRDQVVTERSSEATTLQALELVNGAELTRPLNRGARKLLRQEQLPPVARFDSGLVGGAYANQRNPAAVEFSTDITGARELRLLTVDQASYAPEQVRALWADVFFNGPGGKVPLSALVEPRRSVAAARIKGQAFAEALPVSSSDEIVLDISRRGFTRLEGFVGVDETSIRTDIMPAVRFFVFDREPHRDRLVPVVPGSPVSRADAPREPAPLIEWLFKYCLSRPPSPDEFQLASSAVGKGDAGALADLLWSIAMQPEFQLIQ